MSTLSKHQILVVEDNTEVRGMFSLLLISAGYHVIEAEDGIAALALLRIAARHPRILLENLRSAA